MSATDKNKREDAVEAVFTVPKNVPVHSMYDGEWTTTKRKQVIDLSRPECTVDRYGHGEWTVVTWPGSGGYWRRVVLHGSDYVAEWPS